MAMAVECAVIGGGVVGLACARAAAATGLEVLVLESENTVGAGISSRNSEVIHAGIYYPRGSLKANMCVRGRNMLYEFCESHGVPHRRCGKLIVATSASEIGTLNTIIAKAKDNSVNDLKLLTANEATAMEPELNCEAAVWSPSTGIIDSHSLMLSLQGDAEQNGASIILNCKVETGRVLDGGKSMLLRTAARDGTPALELKCKHVINSAGLSAPSIAKAITSGITVKLPEAYYAKGNYYGLQGKPPFSRLVYPVPQQAGLGVHATIDLAGRMRFGPDVEWIENYRDTDCYKVDPSRADNFYSEVRRYWPKLPDGSLIPDYAGIRPKLRPEGQPAVDFGIWSGSDYGVPALVNLFGIESPGLTSSLAIAEAAVVALFKR